MGCGKRITLKDGRIGTRKQADDFIREQHPAGNGMKPQKTSHTMEGNPTRMRTKSKIRNVRRSLRTRAQPPPAAAVFPSREGHKKALPDESPDRALFTRSMGTTPIPMMHKRESGSPETGFPAQVTVAAYAGTSISFSAFSVRCSFRKVLIRPIRFLQPSDISSSCVW